MSAFVMCLAMAFTGQISGTVISVTDADTVVVRTESKTVKIRLLHIDAPERGQAFGTRSREALEEMVKGRQIEVIGSKKDRNKRTLAEIRLDGKVINLELVKLGLAWAYVDFKPPIEYMQAESEARRAKLGLWADREPTPPWEYRKNRRSRAEGAKK